MMKACETRYIATFPKNDCLISVTQLRAFKVWVTAGGLLLGLFAASYAVADVPALLARPTPEHSVEAHTNLKWEELMGQVRQTAAQRNFKEAEQLALQAIQVVQLSGPSDLRLAKAQVALGNIYNAERKLDLAEETLKAAVESCEQAVGKNDLQIQPALEALAGFYFLSLNRYDLALPLCQRMLAIAEHGAPPDEVEISRLTRNLASVFEKLQRYTEAEALYKQCLSLAEQHKTDVASHLLALTDFYTEWKKYDKAALFAQRSLDLAEQTSEKDPMVVAIAMFKLAEINRASGKADQAEHLYTQCLALTETAATATSSAIVPPLAGRAKARLAQGKNDEAEADFLRALNVAYQTMDTDLPQVAALVSDYADLLILMHRATQASELQACFQWKQLMFRATRALRANHPTEAERLCEEAMRLTTKLPKIDTSLSNSQIFMAEVYRAEGQPEKAEQFYLTALATCEAAVGTKAVAMIAPLEALANFYSYTVVHMDKVALLSERILDIVEQDTKSDPAEVARRARNLADVERSLGKQEAAEKLYKRALATVENAPKPETGDIVQCLQSLSEFYQSMGKADAALPSALRVLALQEQAAARTDSPDAQLDIAVSLDALAKIFIQTGNASSAESASLRSIAIVEKINGIESGDLIPRLSNLSAALRALKKLAEAEKVMKRAVEIAEKTMEAGTPELTAISEEYAALLLQLKNTSKAPRQ
jgi:tetratricopeptide (TPR) repeat protein